MNKILLLLMLLVAAKLSGQEEVTTAEIHNRKIISLIYTVDSLDELNTIQWDNIKEIVKDNDKEDKIAIGCNVKDENRKECEKKYKYKFVVRGKSEDIDHTITIAKRITKAIQKL
ncbi:hypothetical protein [Tenacibaculum amylolyticum]|uniref:hypothetical protein n=1 Tax=Tenacibaculum amylolyticum TaxID=104269 RepID=UPI003895D1E0